MSSANKRNKRSKSFKKQFDKLPAGIQELARKAFDLFKENPDHPSLAHHSLKDSRRGRHDDGSFAVHVTKRYCAIYVPRDGVNIWYWIGSHEDYNNFIGSK